MDHETIGQWSRSWYCNCPFAASIQTITCLPSLFPRTLPFFTPLFACTDNKTQKHWQCLFSLHVYCQHKWMSNNEGITGTRLLLSFSFTSVVDKQLSRLLVGIYLLCFLISRHSTAIAYTVAPQGITWPPPFCWIWLVNCAGCLGNSSSFQACLSVGTIHSPSKPASTISVTTSDTL